jgi:ligand-binding sensor protein
MTAYQEAAIVNTDETIPSFAGLDIALLQHLQDTLAAATGTASIIVDIDGQAVTQPSNFSEVCKLIARTERGAQICEASNRERTEKALASDLPVYQMCQSCGFLDGSVPIDIDGRRVGHWLVGQCNALGVGREEIALHAHEIGADVNKVLAAFDRMAPMSVARFEHVLEFLHLLVRQIASKPSAEAPGYKSQSRPMALFADTIGNRRVTFEIPQRLEPMRY